MPPWPWKTRGTRCEPRTMEPSSGQAIDGRALRASAPRSRRACHLERAPVRPLPPRPVLPVSSVQTAATEGIMKLAGFTPGPWALSDETGNIMRDILGADGSSVCLVFNVRHHMLKNPQPNTDLILAAPELYEALEDALAEMRKRRLVSGGSDIILAKGDAA